MNYIDVEWLHDNPEDPIRLVSELDSEGLEQRKLEFFRDGQIGRATAELVRGANVRSGTTLGTAPVPPIEVINRDPQFHAKHISASDFNALWLQHAMSDA